MRACAFFSPRLNPVLDRGKGHKDTVVSPQMPTRRAVGQAVFNHDAHRQIDHAVGIMTAWWCQIREVGVKVLATFRTVMLRIRDDKITRTPHVEIAQIVQRPMGLLVPIGRVTTTRTRLTRVVATVQDDLGLRQVCKRCHTFGRVGAIRTWTEHRVALLAQRLGPELYDQGLLGATRYPRYSLDNGPQTCAEAPMALVTLHTIFQDAFPAYEQTHLLPTHVRKAARAIMPCRTAALGGHIQAGPDGQVTRVGYHAGRHRSCPPCASL